jgi:catechol 2,3-dioxygenase-like lactoylglutathione lyase family enzyme
MDFTYTGIRVRNLKRALTFYSGAMGMRQILKGAMKHGGIYVHLKSPKSSQRLELNYYPRTKFFEKYHPGSELDHLAFWTRDVDARYRSLLSKGARTAVKPFSEGRYRLAFVKDPDGIWIELIGIAKPSKPN